MLADAIFALIQEGFFISMQQHPIMKEEIAIKINKDGYTQLVSIPKKDFQERHVVRALAEARERVVSFLKMKRDNGS
jgi:hypothetical protein